MKHHVHAEFIFRALDDDKDVANLLSLEVTGFWFNELREINTTILAHAGRRAGGYSRRRSWWMHVSGLVRGHKPVGCDE